MSPERSESISVCFVPPPLSWAMPSIWRRSQRRVRATLAATCGNSAATPPCIGSATSSARSRWGRSLSSSKTARRRKCMTHTQTPTRFYRAMHPQSTPVLHSHTCPPLCEVSLVWGIRQQRVFGFFWVICGWSHLPFLIFHTRDRWGAPH